MSFNKTFSVAICTYNRANSLRDTLTSFCELAIPKDLTWEILLIDNNSTDNTRDIINLFCNRLPLHYFFESEQGLSAARNRALAEFQNDILIFTDDDVIVDSNWLLGYVNAIKEHQHADFFGGRIKPLWQNNNRPKWLYDDNLALLGGLLVHYDLGQEIRYYRDTDPTPFGASFAISRNLYGKIGKFRTELGVKGYIPGRGEEADYLERALKSGAYGVYVGSALCHHTVDMERLRISYLYNFGIQKGIANVRMNRQSAEGSFLTEVIYAVRGLYQLIKGRGDRFRQCIINMGIQKGIRQELQQSISQND